LLFYWLPLTRVYVEEETEMPQDHDGTIAPDLSIAFAKLISDAAQQYGAGNVLTLLIAADVLKALGSGGALRVENHDELRKYYSDLAAESFNRLAHPRPVQVQAPPN
jgi:hypothetical protein